MAVSYFAPDGDNSTRFNQDLKGLYQTDTINGLAQKNARMWQIIALCSLSSFFISLFICGYAVSLPKTVPVIVTVSPEGQAVYAGKVDRSLYGSETIPETAKEYLIKKLLTNMYTWVIDRDAQQMFIVDANAIVQSGAVRQLDLFFRSNNPFTYLGDRTRAVSIEPPLKQTEKTYIVYFTATQKNRNGYTIHSARYSALVNIDLFESTVKNPLGIYITNFDIKLVEEMKE
jgi:type IV secretory pathway TrbF-like protein